jgi:uncharacterized membrane protein YebE (DUF533 family)
MKRMIAGILTTALLALAPVYGQGVLKERENDQKARIKAGVKDGSITKPEAAKLKREQKEIRQDVRQAKSDGVVTGKEAAKITREQNKASRDIVKQKNDKQNRK